MIKRKKFIFLLRNYLNVTDVLSGHLDDVLRLMMKYTLIDSESQLSNYSVDRDSLRDMINKVAIFEDCIRNLSCTTRLKNMDENGFARSLMDECFIRDSIAAFNSAVEPIGNFSNSVLLRHIKIQDRRISIINQKLPPNYQELVKENMIRFSNSMYSMYEFFFMSDKHTTSIKDNVTGFIKGKGYVDHAKAHLNCRSAISVDISKFYDSVSLSGMIENALFYKSLVASFEISTGLPFDEASFENPFHFNVFNNLFGLMNIIFISLMNFYTHNGLLPTGANYSPVISNIIFAPIDLEIHRKVSTGTNIKYTRYADDICISSTDGYDEDGSFKLQMSHVLRIESIIRSYGFYLNYDKTHIMGPRDKKKIAGLIIDSSGDKPKLSIGSDKKLKLKQKYEGSKWSDLNQSDAGVINWVKSINADQYNFITSGIENVPESIKAAPLQRDTVEETRFFILDKNGLSYREHLARQRAASGRSGIYNPRHPRQPRTPRFDEITNDSPF